MDPSEAVKASKGSAFCDNNNSTYMEIKKIWLVNKYAMPPQYESRLRTIKFAHYLQEMGYEVTIFGCSIMHNMNMDLIDDGSLFIERQYGDLKFVHVRSSQYGTATGVKRIISEIVFHYNLVKVMKKLPKADVIVATTDALISNPVLDFAHKNGIKYVKEVLDMWPDIFMDMGLLGKNNPAMKILWHRAKKNYKEVDAAVFSLTECFDYFKQKKWDKENGGPVDMSKVFYINNGVDLKDFNDWKDTNVLDDEDLKSDKKKVIYLGSIRLVNNVGQLVRAAERMQDIEDAEFLIYGDGDDREPLIKYCQEHGLKNVKFKAKWTEPKYVPFILSQSYVNILNYINADFAKYGISSSKMFQYMASGKPMVCNIDLPHCPITANNIGIAHNMKSEEDYATAIRTLLELPSVDYEAMCTRARDAANTYDYEYLTKQMVEVIKFLEK